MIHVLFEADVTDVRKYRRKKKAEGAPAPSITAFIIKCVADAAMMNKRIDEIHDEIHSYAEEGCKSQIGILRIFAKLPRFMRAIFFTSKLTDTKWTAKQGFNIIVTSMGMFGAGGGHIIPYQHSSLCIAVGGITRKPDIVDDRIEPREYLSMTTTFDHDITDGAPAARFAQVLK
jgi:pyruvate/2-oxoglutarate dehydrogenase complex dihydrolipoamide acyltransferase (E2) component